MVVSRAEDSFVAPGPSSFELPAAFNVGGFGVTKPMIQLEQFTAIEDAVRAAPEFIAACQKRGIEDMSLVCIDP